MVRENDIDLVVIATHGRAGLKKFLLGSVAEEIFRSVPCPVLTVGPDVAQKELAGGKLRQIVYATDFSSASMNALPYAVALAQDHDARLAFVHIVEEISNVPLYYRDRTMADARHELSNLIPRDAGLSSEPQMIVEAGEVAETILSIAKDLKAGLLVMGARTKVSPRMAAHLPWAVAHQVVCHAACPVLTVRGTAQ